MSATTISMTASRGDMPARIRHPRTRQLRPMSVADGRVAGAHGLRGPRAPRDNAAMRKRANAMIVVGAMGALASIGWPVVASSPPGQPIELPDTLSGGLTALDLAEAYPSGLDS